MQANNENKIQDMYYFWMEAGRLNMKGSTVAEKSR